MNKYHMGPLIRKIREARGITIADMARAAGFHRCSLSRFERRLKYALKAPECLYPLARELGTTVGALFIMQDICCANEAILDNPVALMNRLALVNAAVKRLLPAKTAMNGKSNRLIQQQREA